MEVNLLASPLPSSGDDDSALPWTNNVWNRIQPSQHPLLYNCKRLNCRYLPSPALDSPVSDICYDELIQPDQLPQDWQQG